MNDVKDDKATSWEQWYEALSPAARRALEREAPAPLDEQPGEALPDNLGEYAFHLIVAPDGAFPRVHSYRRISDLVRQIGRLEAKREDVAVVAVHGTVLPLTVGRPRHLLHPRRKLAISVPVYAGERVRKVSMHLVDQHIQEHGYIGPPELLGSPMPAPKEGKPQQSGSPAHARKAATKPPAQPTKKGPAKPPSPNRKEPPPEARPAGR